MHSLVLITFELQQVEEELEKDLQVKNILKEIQKEKLEHPESTLYDLQWEEHNNPSTPFSRKVADAVLDILERYYDATDNPDYLKFCDRTDELQRKYNETTECLKLPQGTIVSLEEPEYFFRYAIHDGKVYEKYSGPAKQDRRTKRAKRMKAFTEYPWKKLYPDFQEFAEEWSGCRFYEEENAYGFYYNPEGYWDWYSIGGRWPFMLLVKNSCKEYSVGERSWIYEGNIPDAPNGYKWVSGARKKDIAWQTMREWRSQRLTERFSKLEFFFMVGERPEGVYGHLVDDGILYCGEYIYRKDETLEDFLGRFDFKKSCRYPIGASAFINDAGWHSREVETEDICGKDIVEDKWDTELSNLLDSIPEENVLVVVDCHV